MAIYKARLNRDGDGSWIAAAVALPHCWSRGKSEAEAIAKLREEIRYRIEYCPCSGVEDSYVRVEIEVPREGLKPAPGAGGSPAHAPAPVGSWKPTRPVVAAPLSGAAGCPQEPARRPESTGPRRADAPAPRSGWRRWDD